MPYNYSKLIGKIIEKFGTRAAFAEKMGLSEKSLSAKLHNQRAFKQPEIANAISLLEIDKADLSDYFFTPFVQSD